MFVRYTALGKALSPALFHALALQNMRAQSDRRVCAGDGGPGESNMATCKGTWPNQPCQSVSNLQGAIDS